MVIIPSGFQAFAFDFLPASLFLFQQIDFDLSVALPSSPITFLPLTIIDIIGNKKYLPAKIAKRAKKEKSKIEPNLFVLMIV